MPRVTSGREARSRDLPVKRQQLLSPFLTYCRPSFFFISFAVFRYSERVGEESQAGRFVATKYFSTTLYRLLPRLDRFQAG